MAIPTRAKMVVDSVLTDRAWPGLRDEVTFRAEYTDSPEDNTFAKATPSGNMTLTINNEAVVGKFKPGDSVYVDITPAE